MRLIRNRRGPDVDDRELLAELKDLTHMQPSASGRRRALAALCQRLDEPVARPQPVRLRHRVSLFAAVAVVPLLAIGAVAAAVTDSVPEIANSLLGDGREPQAPKNRGDASPTVSASERGCDDDNHAVQGTPVPGGPKDCTAGNSGDHRRNGDDHGKPTQESTPGQQPQSGERGCDERTPTTQATPVPGGPKDCPAEDGDKQRGTGNDRGGNGKQPAGDGTPGQRGGPSQPQTGSGPAPAGNRR